MIPVILKGETSKPIRLALKDGYEYAGCALHVDFCGYRDTFVDLDAGGDVELRYSAEQTAHLPLGTSMVHLSLENALGEIRFMPWAKIKVTDSPDDLYDAQIVIDPATLDVDDLTNADSLGAVKSKLQAVIDFLRSMKVLALAALIPLGVMANMEPIYATLNDMPGDSRLMTNVADYVAAKISTNNAEFVSAVLAAPLVGADPSDLSEIAEYGSYGTVGAALLALIAGLAALKRRIASAETSIGEKADATDLPYALVTPGEWTFSGVPNGVSNYSLVWDDGWFFAYYYEGESYGDGVSGVEDALELSFILFDSTVTATRPSLPGHLIDRAVNKIVPDVVESSSWVWANGEVGTPVYANGFWDVDFGEETGFDYDGPVAGSEDDDEITFVSTSSRTFTFSYDDWDENHVFVFVDDDSGSEVRVVAHWSDSDGDDIVEKLDYDGNEYVLSQRVLASEIGTSVTGTAVVAEHVVTLENTYGPTMNLVMPPAVPGHARDLLVRIDLSQAAGAPPVSFSGGTFETADGEMPELVKGVNLLSFTETEAGVFGVAHKEMSQVQIGGS